MADQTISRIAELLSRHQQQILSDWMANQLAGARSRTGSLSDAARREESGNFLGLLLEALRRGGSTNVSDPAWDGARSALGDLSRSRATQGFDRCSSDCEQTRRAPTSSRPRCGSSPS